MANVKEIEWQGGIYNIADETARGAAQNALSAAQTAQATGAAAQASANAAQTAAGNAQTTANAAQTAAGNAQTTASAAQTAISALSSRVENIESTLGDKVFQIPLTSGLTPEPGYNVGVKSGNVVSITIGVRPQPLSSGHIIATLPEGTRPKIGFIQDTITQAWTAGSHVEITTTGDITLREAS